MMRPSLTTSVAAAAACLFVAASAAAEAKPKANPPVAADAKLDCNAFETAAKELFSKGSYAASLKQAEAAAKCTGTNAMATIAATAACKIKNSDRARYWSARLEETQRLAVVQACATENIVLAAPVAAPAQDCKALTDEGRTNFNNGKFAEALTSFEAAMRCDPKRDLALLTALAACRGKNKEKALQWSARVADAKITPVMQVCMVAGIELPPRPAPAKTAPTSTGQNPVVAPK